MRRWRLADLPDSTNPCFRALPAVKHARPSEHGTHEMSLVGFEKVRLAIDGSDHANRAAQSVAREASVLAIREAIVLYVDMLGSHHTYTVAR